MKTEKKIIEECNVLIKKEDLFSKYKLEALLWVLRDEVFK